MKLEADRIVGNYRVVRPLGVGGMGSVYEVEHVRLGIRYAMKVFAAEGKDAAFLRVPAKSKMGKLQLFYSVPNGVNLI